MDISTTITINGRTYHSVDQMPPDVREQYQVAMATMKDIGADANAAKNLPIVSSLSESIIYNGRRYQHRDELPPEVRALLDTMPAGNPTDIQVKTIKTFRPRVAVQERTLEESDGRPAPEADPVTAWLLVKILAVVVMILLLLLGAKHLAWP